VARAWWNETMALLKADAKKNVAPFQRQPGNSFSPGPASERMQQRTVFAANNPRAVAKVFGLKW
jgi:hypothetical protein